MYLSVFTGNKMVEVLPFARLILCIVALAMDISLSFTPMYWVHQTNEEAGSTFIDKWIGLWNYCIKDLKSGEETCYQNDDYPFNFMFVGGARVFQCLGVLLLVTAIVFIILKIVILKEKECFTVLSAAHAMLAGLCFIDSAVTFGDGIKNERNVTEVVTDLHFSFAFAIISGIIAFAGGLVLLLAFARKEYAVELKCRL